MLPRNFPSYLFFRKIVPVYVSTRFVVEFRRADATKRFLMYVYVTQSEFITHWLDEDSGAQTYSLRFTRYSAC